ncbi:unnamed protein product [Soboliphyme baturini]|uniref:DUF676 domain-containing protein n=1 Tax=Soboliphyme baturini TaxID=241478 RepID=A0A183J029_9BILA|nr:unnamed protein product [Soboliphyme baturini]
MASSSSTDKQLVSEGKLKFATAWSDIKFSVDLSDAVPRELYFLRLVDRNGSILYNEEYVKNSIRRYEQCWLPLMAKVQNKNIIPPLDVHWIWHTHMLAPQYYFDDCLKLVGTVVDHRLFSSDEIQQRFGDSYSLWTSYHPSEPYDFASVVVNRCSRSFTSRLAYDLCAASRRQQDFNYQVSLPHFNSPKFMAEAIERYKRFVFLKAMRPNDFLTPLYDFDIVWHAHQVHPVAYAEDTKRVKYFPEKPYFRQGCMYRGHSAPELLGFSAQDFSCITNCRVNISSISLKILPTIKKSVRLNLHYGSKKVAELPVEFDEKFASHQGRRELVLVWEADPSSGRMSTVEFDVDLNKEKYIFASVELYERSFLLKKELVKLHGRINVKTMLCKYLNNGTKNVISIDLGAEKTSADLPPLKSSLGLTTHLSVNIKLELIAGSFNKLFFNVLSETHKLCRAFSLNMKGLEEAKFVLAACHRFFLNRVISSKESLCYNVNVIHSAKGLLSAVLVFDSQERLIASSHLLGPGSIPTKSQLEEHLQFFPHLSSPDERAMVVSNRDGDFAVFKAKWVNIPYRDDKDEKYRSHGHLLIDALNLMKNTTQKFEIPGADDLKIKIFGGMTRKHESCFFRCLKKGNSFKS